MEKLFFRLSVDADKETGRILAVYLQVRKGKAVEVEELAEGAAFANYNKKGQLLGLEILGPCQVTVIERIVKSEPAHVRNFFKNNLPRKLAMTPRVESFRNANPTTPPRQVPSGRRYSSGH